MAGAARGELNVEVSEEKGLGEDSMMTFIRLHLASILQPFAGRVDALRQEVEELRGVMAEADTRAKAKLADHTVSIREIRNELESLSQEAAEAKAEAGRATALQPDIQSAQADISALADRFRTVQATSFELQHEARANCQHLGRLQAELAQQDQRMAKKLEDTAQELHSHLVALESAGSARGQAVEAAGKAVAEAREEVRKLASASERQARKDEAALAQLRSSLAGTDALARNADHRLSETAERLKAAGADIGTLQTRTEQALKMQATLEARQKDTAGDLSGTKQRIEDVNARVSRMSEQVGISEEPTKAVSDAGGSLLSLVQGLSERADRASVHLNELDQASRRQLEQLNAGDARTEKLETAQGSLQESVANLDARTVQRALGLEALLRQQGQSQQQDAARLEADGAAWQKALLERMQALDHEMARVTEGVKKNSKGLEMAGGRLEHIQGDLSQTNESLTKLSGTMDLTQEYWKGLTKGFRQTHRSVAVDNDLFSSRDVGTTSALPALPVKPAPAQGGSAMLSSLAR